MRKRFSVLACLCCQVFLILQVPGVSRQAAERIRVQTTLVNVAVMVSDSRGGAVLGLKSGDFALYDDGRLREAAFFVAAEEPIRVALLLDTSKSTITVLDKIRKAAEGFLSELRSQDEAMVISFDSEVHVLGRWSSDKKELKSAIRRAQVADYVGTTMFDAISWVGEKHFRQRQGRKAIILLTDGQDYGSVETPDQVMREMADAGVVVYPIFYRVDRRELARKLFGVNLPKGPAGGASWEGEERAAAAILNRLAVESAGTFYQSEVTDLKRTFARVAEELRHQYLLAFYPDPARVDGLPHALRVDVSKPGLIVRTRPSYQAQATARLP